MNKEKQIEEMKSIIDKAEEEYSEIWNEWFYDHKEGTKIDNEFLFFAKLLYNAGYRKASDVAEEIFAEIDKLLRQHRIEFDMSCVDFYFEKHYAELKKKFTEGKV